MSQIQIQASNARPTTTGVNGAVDVNVHVTLPDGREVRGEVTLCPAEDGRPVYESWGGGADHWVSGGLLAELYAVAEGDTGIDREALRTMLREIEAAAQEEAGAPER